MFNTFDLGFLGCEYKKIIQNKTSLPIRKKKRKEIKRLTEEEKEYNKDLKEG